MARARVLAEKLETETPCGDCTARRGCRPAAEDGPAAEEAWRQARLLAEGAPELLNRVLIRRGDLFAMTGARDRAADDYARAADGFAQLNLPVREAWTQLRLGRLGHPDAVERARFLFRGADMAAGVAAADAVRGDPGLSAGWHLERAAQHARDRANAQRLSAPDSGRRRAPGAATGGAPSGDLGLRCASVHTLAGQLDATVRNLSTCAAAPETRPSPAMWPPWI